MNTARRSGFTLIELLVVITILAILSVIGITAYSGIQKNARDAKRKGDLRSIKIALELYKQTTGSYPVGQFSSNSTTNPWITGLGFEYMANGVPRDPIIPNVSGDPRTTPTVYNFRYESPSSLCGTFAAGQYFELVAQLENKQDGDRHGIKQYKYCTGSTYPNLNDSAYVVNSL